MSPAVSSTSSCAEPRSWFNRLAVAALTACLLVLAAACGGDDDDGAAATSTDAPGTRPAGGATATPEDSKPSLPPTPTPPPPGASVAANDEPVAFGTEDGVTLRGHLYGVAGPKRRVVVFAHEYPRDQKAWQPFARELAASGTAALTFDFRGYGETGGAKDASKADRDLLAAVRFVASRDYPLVYVVGASFGGTAALKVAAQTDLAGIATVSAPLSFMGLDARPDLSRITERKLFVASRGDGDAPAAVSTFMQQAPEPKQSQLYDGSAHGTELLAGANAAQFKALLTEFLSR